MNYNYLFTSDIFQINFDIFRQTSFFRNLFERLKWTLIQESIILNHNVVAMFVI